ncbi:MAG: nitric oxide synthase [Deltaproteobacteria bacterium]|nr:MAG: nitric oxide synthase [Deltaproteobacteria bacterium]RLB80073.1 MAG: nitric oxide synthase [Deltaproteobacteria bacterium]
MGKALIIYDSRTGKTEQMAQYIAEGIRFSGNEVEVKKVQEIKNEKELEGYDAYVFGSPTYHRDMIGTMKTFLFLAEKANLEGKLGGAFGSYTHSGDAPKIILDTLEFVFKMKISRLGSLRLKENTIGTPDGIKACQDYGRSIGEALNQ